MCSSLKSTIKGGFVQYSLKRYCPELWGGRDMGVTGGRLLLPPQRPGSTCLEVSCREPRSHSTVWPLSGALGFY